MPEAIWSSNWDVNVNKAPPTETEEEQRIVGEAKARFKICVDYEGPARVNFEYDYKFANGDSHNKYQWDNNIVLARENDKRPCLTVNKTAQHNLMVINDSKQNKPGIRIRPVGETASYDAAQVFQELVYHIEYISNAENIYDSAMSFQVQAGIGYWRVSTDYINDDSFDQEIYIRRIKDPRSVYLDPNINEIDGSDAWFGFIFEDMAKELFRAKYPEFASIADNTVMGESSADGWISQHNVRVCEYFRKSQEKSKLVTWIGPNDGVQVLKKIGDLNEYEKLLHKQITADNANKELYQYNERRVLLDKVYWYKIAGDRIIDKGEWLGKYIPIVRCVGTETVIDGIMDRKGHTRALIDPQRMYNWNASADVEYGALQTKAPWIAPSAAIEGFEEYYRTANSVNHSYLPYNHIDEDGNAIPAPQRPLPPQPSPAYVQRMEISMNEMMQASGQFQAQFGEAENAKSGVAINARQRQGDRATYHFLDNQAIAIRFTGKIIIDLAPKIYDTKRVMRITARDGTVMNVTIDPKARQDYQELPTQETDKEEKIKEILFNPTVGTYDIQSDVGPSYATRRMDAFNALTQIAAQNPDFMNIGGDVYFKVADFPEADTLAQRYRRAIPPAILGEGPDPNTEAAMNAAADKIEQLTALVGQQSKEIADKDAALKLQAEKLELDKNKLRKDIIVDEAKENRDDYDAETRRLTAIANAGTNGEGVSMKELQPLLKQLLKEMKGDDLDDDTLSKTDAPPIEGAKKAKDGKYYLEENGQYFQVE